MHLDWQCLEFARTPPHLLYGVLALRSQVFVVEQRCIYQDADGEDLAAQLVIGSLPASDTDAAAATGAGAAGVVATARILRPGTRLVEASIGRVCTAAAYRGQGLGKALMHFAIQSAQQRHPGQRIRISAQAYLQDFYASFGFEPVSARYLEDGIEHLEMRLSDPVGSVI